MPTSTEPLTWSRDIPVLVFVNRAASRNRASSSLPHLQTLLESHGVPVKFVETSSTAELELEGRLAAGQNHHVLLALGGDGTFQALVNGVYGSDVTIGILPAGGGNDFAAALGLPSDPVSAVQVILKAKPRSVDLVRVRTADGRTRLYAGGGGIGLDAEAAQFASGPYRRLPGRLRYVASALRALYGHLPLKVLLEFPGTDFPSVESVSLLACALNTPTYGAGLRLAPDARIDDGLLQVVVLEDSSKLSVLRLLPRLISSGELRTSKIKRWSVRSVRISADRPCLFHGDGEIFGPAPVEIEVVPNAVRVLAPAAEA
ncbi:MAG TPA: diacylglycerol kinase family protein [Candidatus Acidoferrum sp.]|nr:diacylglycerol kinase family protein [Candidatus Acidoferrum sp.]